MIKITASSNDLKKFEQIQKRMIRRPKEILTEVGKQEVINTQRRITTTKVDPDGKTWRPWAMATLRQRLRQGNRSLGLLRRTGFLLRSVYYKLNDMRLEVGASAKYARYLQFGTKRMPARPFMGWSKDSINKITQAFTEIFK